jgi:hypothetical protein
VSTSDVDGEVAMDNRKAIAISDVGLRKVRFLHVLGLKDRCLLNANLLYLMRQRKSW